MGLSATNSFFEQFDKLQQRQQQEKLLKINQLFQGQENDKSREQQATLTREQMAQQQGQFESAQAQQQQQFNTANSINEARMNIYRDNMKSQNEAIQASIVNTTQNTRMVLGEALSKGIFKPATSKDPGAFQSADKKWYAPEDPEKLNEKQLKQQEKATQSLLKLQAQQAINNNLMYNRSLANLVGAMADPNDPIAANFVKSLSSATIDPRSAGALAATVLGANVPLQQLGRQYNDLMNQWIKSREVGGEDAPETQAIKSNMEVISDLYRNVTSMQAGPQSMFNGSYLRTVYDQRGDAVIQKINAEYPDLMGLGIGSPQFNKGITRAMSNMQLPPNEQAAALGWVRSMTSRYSPPSSISGAIARGEGGFGTPEYNPLAGAGGPRATGVDVYDPGNQPTITDGFAQGVTSEEIVKTIIEPTNQSLQRIYFGQDRGDPGRKILQQMWSDGTIERRMKNLELYVEGYKWDKYKDSIKKSILGDESSVKPKGESKPKPKDESSVKPKGLPIGAPGWTKPIKEETKDVAKNVVKGAEAAATSVVSGASSFLDFLQPYPEINQQTARGK